MQQGNTIEAFEALKEYMRANHNAKIVSGGREILKRCHLCGDSHDHSSAHMYIGVKNDVILYNCFKCNSGGVVDSKFLRNIGCYDTLLIELCESQISKYERSHPTRSGALKSVLTNEMFIPNTNNEFAEKKLQYLSNRLGYNFSYADCVRYKIVLNLKDFLNQNEIFSYSRDERVMDDIDRFFIGFISMNQSYVILRRLVPEGKLNKYIDYRYLDYNIFGDNSRYSDAIQGGTKFYTIPTKVDVLQPVEIHIAEGVFDILSIYLTYGQNTNGIFGAVCGKSYMSLVTHLMALTGLTGFTLHIYPDNDVADNAVRQMAYYLSQFQISTYVHRNIYEGQKDFGVHPSLINKHSIKIM